MTFFPKRRAKERMGVREKPWIRLPQHLQWISGLVCILAGKPGHVCRGKVRACHLRLGTDGCGGEKPSDCFTWPGCDGAHDDQHRVGEVTFQNDNGLDLAEVCRSCWSRSPAAARYVARTRHADELRK